VFPGSRSRFVGVGIILSILIMSAMAIAIHAELSDSQAEQKFNQLGCTGCHNGKTADEWDEIVEDIEEEWAEEYPTIDEAAKHVDYDLEPGVTFNSFDDLMAKMAKNVNKDPNDPDIVALKDYFKAKFDEGKMGGGEEEEGTNFKLIGGIIIVIIIIVLAAYLLKGKK